MRKSFRADRRSRDKHRSQQKIFENIGLPVKVLVQIQGRILKEIPRAQPDEADRLHAACAGRQ
jgi:hypothetical protein